MRFCSYLIDDINFEPDAIQPCCNLRELGGVPRFSFAGGEVDMSAYGRHIEKIVGMLQKRDSGMCAGCPELKNIKPQDKMEMKFHTVSINKHRFFCNCRCVYCDLWEKKQADPYSILPAIRSLYDQSVLHPHCLFSWGGGEPSILKEFEEVSGWILNHGYSQYVHTSALRWSPTIASMLAKGKGEINISLDSGSAAMYEAVKGVNGFERVTKNIRRYIEASNNAGVVHIKYIIFNANSDINEVARFFSVCQQLGVIHVQFSFNFDEVNNRTLSKKSLYSALFFIKRASELHMRCQAFAVDKSILALLGVDSSE
jgi:sulfatase maturation enzyme AslB (radical SAM superfamily)